MQIHATMLLLLSKTVNKYKNVLLKLQHAGNGAKTVNIFNTGNSRNW